ncbi:hypothetical protein PHYSODRAFT_333458 [Phytophthora sojae]|uniref:FYVE-type domain-containing protein n=1 Tax=Phytophthora sojae (strain P6497) TaxID=1094619 RepID=G4ZQF1_PHYSP|nr:hypothetical protein PHYSODRAFT_333458 [Phytophthora sojae]EGZ15186.1 hypothetical protein PHYSODRAFT_333458 [Phytophthora sojae]|eukprot:XP_009528935.1 hypothetical protein PHYSODRAFT_333458 [Phytophthora sojae]
MKFPLPKNIFPPLELSEGQEQGYEQLANALIKATLTEYDQFVMHDRKRVDARRWKAIRTRDGVSIYRERDVDGVRRPAPATLALYQSAISTTRPSQNARASGGGPHVSSDLSDSRNHTISINGPLHFGPPMTPKKSKSSSDTDYSRDTSRNDSYSSGGLPSEPRITTGAFSSTDNESAGLPRLLAVGTLRGSLDDVMYGVVSPNASSVRLRSSYLGEHIADCAVLREMKSPSPSDPFRFLGIKWFVRAKHRGAARIVLPRDFVVLEFSGVMMRPDNSRVGFHLMHSVEIPTCRELHEHRILRAKLSSCYIFEETRNNRVQVFMTASVEPNGHVLNRMALRSAATALSNCWKSVSCAHNKKLAFCLQNERPSAMGLSSIASTRGGHSLGGTVIRSSRGGLSALTPVNESIVRESIAPEPVSQRSNYSSTVHRRQCGVCRGKLGVLSKSILCQLCCEQICSRCRIVRKLSSDTLNSQVTQSSINFCKKCVASVNDESALEIARQELWVRSRGRTRASSAMSRTNARNSFSSERNTYATVVLGRGSEMNSRGSTATSSLGLSRGPSSYSQPSSFSQSRGPQQEESSLGFSVGPRPSTSTQSSTPLQRPSSGGRLSKNFSLNTFSLSAGPLLGNRVANDALSLSDLDNNKGVTNVGTEKTEAEEPVVLDHRMTMTIRSLRHLDYVLSVGEQDLVDELENEDTEEEFGGFESADEDEGRSSYASSVAVLDDNYEACETPMSNEPQSQREAPIVEGEEDEEVGEEDNEEPEQKEEQELQQAEKETEVQDQSSESVHEEQEPEEEEEGSEQTQVEAQKPEQTESTTVAMAMSVHGDFIHADAAMAEEVEVVEAAPIAEVHAMMLNQYELQKNAKPDAVDEQEPKQRLQRAHTTVPSSDKSNYQNQLLQQMQDLHNVAETTYQVARANTEAAFKERDSGRISNGTGSLRGVRTYSQPFAFNVVGLRSTRAMTVGIDK